MASSEGAAPIAPPARPAPPNSNNNNSSVHDDDDFFSALSFDSVEVDASNNNNSDNSSSSSSKAKYKGGKPHLGSSSPGRIPAPGSGGKAAVKVVRGGSLPGLKNKYSPS